MAFIGDSSSSSSSSSVTRKWAHDVFLSFRGEDTRNNFTAHLYAALDQKGIKTYIDNDLERGENISPALLKAIEESRISVIVLSQNYASSSWCLDELAMILECKETKGQIVLPVFYKVDPSEVRHQRNSFGEVFVKHEERFKNDQMKVQRWKTALKEVANLSGCDLKNYRNEHDFIQEIIEWVNSMLVKETYFQVAKYPVGIKSRVKAVKSLLNIKKKDSTCIVGIVGTGGIGKTTLAKAIYNSIASQFEGSCILANVRETSRQKDGLIHLQNKLLSKILGGSSQIVDNVDQGVALIEERLHLKRILLVLDDVDELVQLEMLAEKTNWFGLGSKIIITTRNKHLLCAYDGVASIYPVKELGQYKALRLFSWYAFKSDKPNDGYVEVTEDAIRYCGGLPLALTVLGSALKGRDILYWKSKLDEYRKIPHKDIQKILRISFDGLDENAKNIFLDIACFFKGEDVEFVRKVLDGCGFYSNSGIDELKDKCLITECWELSLDFVSFKMHDLLEEMGREIVRQESSKEPGKRNRLWFHEDVRHVLEGNTGTNKIEGILIDLPESDPMYLSPEVFRKMKRLRLFIIRRNACFSEEPKFFFNELRLLDWPFCPGESLPSNFCGKNLIVLKMPHSQFKELEGIQNSQKMRIMDFTNCEFLKKIPDVSRIPNLEKLVLNGCTNLVEIHCSVGFLDKLVYLGLQRCPNIRSFPSRLRLRSLESLGLRGCSKIKNFPKIECQMKCLRYINFEETSIEKLPSSFEYLVGVETLNLRFCTNLTKIPNSIHQLQHLKKLSLDGCTSIKELPSSIGYLSRIETLGLDGCTNLMNLPDNIYQLQHLEILNLKKCEQLRAILRLPSNVVEVDASWCVSLTIFLEEAKRSQLLNTLDPSDPVGVRMTSLALQSLSLGNNVVTETDFSIQHDCPSSLKSINLSYSSIVSLPTWLNRFVGLEELYLDGCKQLREIPELPPNIKNVYARGCTSLERFQSHNINNLPMLEWIDFSECHGLRDNMGDAFQSLLMSEGLPKDCDFACIFMGNKIPDCFSHHKEVSNTEWCKIDIDDHAHLDSVNTIFAFCAVIGTKDVPDEEYFEIFVEVINDGQLIYFHRSPELYKLPGSDRVWLNYHVSYHSQLKMDKLRVNFTLEDEDGDLSDSVFFKSCELHLEQKRCRGDDDDDGNLEFNWYPQQQRHPATLVLQTYKIASAS